MVLLTVTAAAKRAIDEYCRTGEEKANDFKESLAKLEVDSPIEHQHLIDISRYLVEHRAESSGVAKEWRLETLLKGAAVYQPPPPAKPEPVSHVHHSGRLKILTI
jgi:hypothetical protein